MPKYLSFVLIFILIALLAFASLQIWTPSEDAYIVEFTTAEREWLKDHPIITVAIDPEFAPYEYYRDNKAHGIAMDYLEYIEYQYNLKFEFTHTDNWTDSVEAVKTGEADMLSAVAKTPQREEFLLFSEPYTIIQNVVLIRNDYNDNFDDTELASMHVAVIKDYYSQNLLELHYPGINLYKATDISDGLRALSLGRVDAFVVDSAQATFYIPEVGANNLKMNSNISLGFDLPLHFGVRQTAPELRNILSKIVNGIPADVDEQILNNWNVHAFEPGISSSLILTVIAIAAIIVLSSVLMIAWNSTLNTQVEDKTKDMRKEIENKKIVESQLRDLINAIPYPVSVKTHEGIYIYANEAYSDLVSIPVANIIGQQDRELYKVSPYVNETIMLQGDEYVLGTNQTYRINAHVARHSKGRLILDSTKLPFKISDNAPNGILNFSVDITEQYDTAADLKELNENLEEIVESRIHEYTQKNEELVQSLNTLQESEHKLIDLNKELEISLEVLNKTQDKLVEVEKFAALGRSASAIAHEMNTPLGVGISAISFGQSEIRYISNGIEDKSLHMSTLLDKLDRVEESLHLVESSVSKMLTVTHSLNLLTMEEWNEPPVSFELKSLIETCYNMQYEIYSKQFPQFENQLHFELNCDEGIHLNASIQAFGILFENLINNTFSHGFVAYKEPKVIRIACSKDDAFLKIRYEDNGVGIEDSQLASILEPLYTSKRGSGFLGLGLSIVYNVVVRNFKGKLDFFAPDSGGFGADIKISTKHIQ